MTEGSKVENRIRRLLEDSDLEYQVLPCAPELADTDIFCEHYGYPTSRSANTIVVKAKTGGERFVACLVLADSRLDVNKTVRKRINARRVSFASPEETIALCGMELGGVTPLGLPEELPLWVDSRVMDQPFVILGGGDRSTKIKVSPRIFEMTPNTEIVDALATQPPEATTE